MIYGYWNNRLPLFSRYGKTEYIPNVRMMELQMKCPPTPRNRSRSNGIDERTGAQTLRCIVTLEGARVGWETGVSLSLSLLTPRGEEKQAFLHEFRSKIHNDTKVEEVDITKIVPTSRVRFASAVAGLDRPSTLYFSDLPNGSYPTCKLLQSVAVPGYRQ